MPDSSAILGLPYLLPSQAQKHVTHNEALRRLDILVQLAVTAIGAETPPADPEDGAVWALGSAPTGAWAGQADRLAAWIDGTWIFIAPRPGWRAWDQDSGALYLWDGAAWTVPASATELSGVLGLNASADATNRLAVAAPATLLTHDGAGHRLKLNKAAPGDTASLLFQSGWTGHAEMGLAGDIAFSVKVSPDGGSWTTALIADPASGEVALPAGLTLGGGTARLDAYETGLWTPEIADADGGGATGSATTATGRYTRLGEQVTVSFALEGIDTAGLTLGNTLFIRGLPFAARGHGSSRFTAPARLGDVTFSSAPFLYLSSGGTALRLMQNVSGGAADFLQVSAFASGTADIYGALVYRI